MVATKSNRAEVGASYLNDFAAGVTTVVTPAANTRGIVIRTFARSSTAAGIGLYADTAAPSAYTDLTKRRVWVGGGTEWWMWFGEIFIPPGNGLYVAASALVLGNMTYDVL